MGIIMLFKRSNSKYQIMALCPYVAVIIGIYLLHNAMIAIALYHLGIIAGLFCSGRMNIFKTVFTGFNWPIALIMATLSLSVGLAVYFLWPYAKLEGVHLAQSLGQYGVNGFWAYVFSIYSIMANPILEEVLWRGFFKGNPYRPVWIDAAFAGYHVFVLAMFISLPIAILAFVVLSLSSWILRLVRHHLGGLAVPCLMHFAADVAIFIAVALRA